jgi:hypothetical protein
MDPHIFRVTGRGESVQIGLVCSARKQCQSRIVDINSYDASEFLRMVRKPAHLSKTIALHDLTSRQSELKPFRERGTKRRSTTDDVTNRGEVVGFDIVWVGKTHEDRRDQERKLRDNKRRSIQRARADAVQELTVIL